MPEKIRKVVKYQGHDFDLSQGDLTPFQIYYLNINKVLSTPEAMLAAISTDAKARGKCPLAAWEQSYLFMSEVLSSFDSEEDSEEEEEVQA